MTELDELWMKVAQALGYIDNGVTNDDSHEFYLLSAEGRQYFYIDGEVADTPLPNWTEDIAAVYRLESEIPENERICYIDCLHTVISAPRTTWGASGWELAHATPQQRCLAFLARKEAQP